MPHEFCGVSMMQDEKQFVCRAVDEYPSLDMLPHDLHVITLPGGVYVC